MAEEKKDSLRYAHAMKEDFKRGQPENVQRAIDNGLVDDRINNAYAYQRSKGKSDAQMADDKEFENDIRDEDEALMQLRKDSHGFTNESDSLAYARTMKDVYAKQGHDIPDSEIRRRWEHEKAFRDRYMGTDRSVYEEEQKKAARKEKARNIVGSFLDGSMFRRK